MKQFLMTAAGVFAGMLIFLIGVPFVLVSLALSAAGPAPIPARSVLELDLRQNLTDQAPQNPLWGIGRSGESVMTIIETLRRAEKDDRVKGLLVRLPEGGLEPGSADELRLALNHFRAAGKPVYAHSQGIYPGGIVTATYMLGAASDQFWMQPGASLQVTGIVNEDLFFKRFFDKYGVVPEYEQRYEYKNAVNGYLYSDYTAAHRESTLSWIGSVYASNLGFAAADRKGDAAALKTALEAGPYQAEDALKLKLVDKVGQVREAEQALLDQAGDGAQAVDFDDYADGSRSRDRRVGDSIALIEAEGPIITGTDHGTNPFTGGKSIYSDDLAQAILRAAKAGSVKAIVLRLNSPGGSDTASEQILDAIRVAKSKKKPVVVSMGTYGASGGYWVSSEASAIVAEPTTLTGSIGVFGGKFVVQGLWDKIGLHWDSVQGGRHADFESPNHDYTDEE
ncbi:MAG TPA: S49 family peptidase, partial [Phenylobacterium sp.]|nr:S49 family peptidase [Phenylobacterium sp.]